MGLLSFLIKRKPSKSKSYHTNGFGDRLDRLTSDGDLPWGWVTSQSVFTEKIRKEFSHFLNAWIDSQEKSPKEQYAALKSFVMYMNDVKELCYSKGECFDFWRRESLFSDEYMKKLGEIQDYIQVHFDDLQGKYEREQYIIKEILPKIPNIVKDNPCILQTEVYKMFPEDCKDMISYELYKLSKDGKIIREKSGRTYSLKVNK